MFLANIEVAFVWIFGHNLASEILAKSYLTTKISKAKFITPRKRTRYTVVFTLLYRSNTHLADEQVFFSTILLGFSTGYMCI